MSTSLDTQRNTDFSPLAVLALGMWFLCGIRGPLQNDTWWHLAAGRLITETGKPLTIDPFSWITAGKAYWPDHEWLSQVGMYHVYTAFHATGLHILAGALFLITGLVVWRSSDAPDALKAAVMTAVLPILATGSAARPHLVTMALLTFLVRLLQIRMYSPIPIAFLCWANLHGGVCIGGTALALATVSSAFILKGDALRLVLITISSAVLVLINPLGIDLYVHPLRSTEISRALPLIEWASPLTIGWVGIFYIGIIGMFLLCAIIQRKRVTSWKIGLPTILSIGLLPLTILHARTMVLITPVVCIALINLINCTNHRGESKDYVRRLIVATMCMVLIVCISATSMYHSNSFSDAVPVSEEGKLAIERAPEHLYNTYDVGGYLIWFVPERKVFVDSRQDPYPARLLGEAIYVQQSGDYQQFFENFQIRSAVVERHFPIHRALVNDGWRISYRGPLFDLLEHP